MDTGNEPWNSATVPANVRRSALREEADPFRDTFSSQLVKVYTEASLYSRLEFSKEGGCDLSKALIKRIRCEKSSAWQKYLGIRKGCQHAIACA